MSFPDEVDTRHGKWHSSPADEGRAGTLSPTQSSRNVSLKVKGIMRREKENPESLLENSKNMLNNIRGVQILIIMGNPGVQP